MPRANLCPRRSMRCPALRATLRVIPAGCRRQPTAGSSWSRSPQARHRATAAACGSRPHPRLRRPARWRCRPEAGPGQSSASAGTAPGPARSPRCRTPVCRKTGARRDGGWRTPAATAAGTGHRSRILCGSAPGPHWPASPARPGPWSGSPHRHAGTRSRSGAGCPAFADPPGSRPATGPPAATPAGDRIEGQGAASSSALRAIRPVVLALQAAYRPGAHLSHIGCRTQTVTSAPPATLSSVRRCATGPVEPAQSSANRSATHRARKCGQMSMFAVGHHVTQAAWVPKISAPRYADRRAVRVKGL